LEDEIDPRRLVWSPDDVDGGQLLASALTDARTFKCVPQNWSEPCGPDALGPIGFDQVMTEFDQCIGPSEPSCMTVDTVSIKGTGIRLVPAHADVRFFLEALD